VNEILVERGRYFDSVFLMRISRELEAIPGVRRAVVAMGTLANLAALASVGFKLTAQAVGPQAGPSPGDASAWASPLAGPQAGLRADDLVTAIDAADRDAFDAAKRRLAELLTAGTDDDEKTEDRPATLDEALTFDAAANLALISVPGPYAAAEARRALRRGLHVMIFSDNVSVEDEIALKDEAAARGLLVMGPDCGTAILNGVPLGFANVVRRGSIGLAGASGTGIQEVSSLIDRLGGGISQAIGTGGRDLSEAVGGGSTLAAIDLLARDPETAVLVVVSKAPAKSVADRVVARLRDVGKPAVVQFVGALPRSPEGKILFADTLDDAARAACRLAGVEVPVEATPPNLPRAHFQPELKRGLRPLRGLFCGGTLAQEAWVVLRGGGLEVRSNVAVDPALKVKAGDEVRGHVIWDLGDDAFTVGKPHPMIEPALRDDLVAAVLGDQDVGVVLVDCVLGYGAHADPAGSLAVAVARQAGQRPAVIASITGTERDPQSYREQRRTLEAAGIFVLDSNAAAARCALELTKRAAGGGV
jgi:succinyl-CoA synthetase alpha subunit